MLTLAALTGVTGAVVVPAADATPIARMAPTTAGRATDALPAPTQDPATSNQKADEILSRSEFQETQPGLYDRVTRWIGDALGSLISGLFVGGAGTALAWAILAIAVGLTVLLVLRLVRTVQPDPGRPVAPMAVEVRRSPVEWHREAEAFEARGEWKAALRCRYRALVADLVSRKVVRDQPGHTTGEYRADVADALPAVAAEFSGASELFERAWYGDRPTGPDENARFRELAEVVVVGAGARPSSHAKVGATSGPTTGEGPG